MTAHTIQGLTLGIMHVLPTGNPESSRKILERHVKEADLQWLYRLGAEYVQFVLWDEKTFKKAKIKLDKSFRIRNNKNIPTRETTR